MATGVILAAVYLFTQIEYKDLSLFGLRMKEGVSQRGAILTALWLVFFYNAVAYAYHVYWDFRVWRDNLTAPTSDPGSIKLYFPELKMFFGRPPKDAKKASEGLSLGGTAREWDRTKENSDIHWRPRAQPEAQSNNRYLLKESLVQRIRERVHAFFAWDIAAPIAPFTVAGSLAVWEHSSTISSWLLHVVLAGVIMVGLINFSRGVAIPSRFIPPMYIVGSVAVVIVVIGAWSKISSDVQWHAERNMWTARATAENEARSATGHGPAPDRRSFRDGRSTPINGRAGGAAGSEQMCQTRKSRPTPSSVS